MGLFEPAASSRLVTWGETSRLPAPPVDSRVQYGDDPLQFGELRLPEGPGPHPLAVVIHGGCWRAENDLQHISPASGALANRGVATWTLEYRRIGDAGGGWTGTFDDVARGTDFVRTLAQRFPIDLDRVVLVGHSAGGHLALWLAARRNLPPESPLFGRDPLPVRGVVSLAAITDLATFGEGSAYCNASVAPLLGGSPREVPERYVQASPIRLLPLGVPSRLVHGARDSLVPVEQSRGFAEQATGKGDDVRLSVIDGAGHFDLIAPFAPAWKEVEETILDLLAVR